MVVVVVVVMRRSSGKTAGPGAAKLKERPRNQQWRYKFRHIRLSYLLFGITEFVGHSGKLNLLHTEVPFFVATRRFITFFIRNSNESNSSYKNTASPNYLKSNSVLRAIKKKKDKILQTKHSQTKT